MARQIHSGEDELAEHHEINVIQPQLRQDKPPVLTTPAWRLHRAALPMRLTSSSHGIGRSIPIATVSSATLLPLPRGSNGAELTITCSMTVPVAHCASQPTAGV
jgi:hypothetical protein